MSSTDQVTSGDQQLNLENDQKSTKTLNDELNQKNDELNQKNDQLNQTNNQQQSMETTELNDEVIQNAIKKKDEGYCC